MKRFFYVLVFVMFIGALSSCGSSKSGCGMTADNQQIDTEIIADTE